MTKRTILLIEDERSISEPLMDALAREGFEPILAETAEAGMEVFAQRGRGDATLRSRSLTAPGGPSRACRNSPPRGHADPAH